MIALWMFACVFALLLAGFPVAFTLGGTALVFGLLFLDPALLALLPLRIWGIMSNYVLMAVPLFVFMGVLLEKSGVAEELLESTSVLFGRLRGGLAISVIGVGGLLAASTGIVGATVVTMGMMSLPTMLKKGYSPEVSTGTIAAAGTLGQIIPPSIVLVLLGSVLNVPVGDLFMGALLPGLLLVGLYVVFVGVRAWRWPASMPGPPSRERTPGGRELSLRLAKALVPPLFLIAAVLGTIFTGIASPTEAAGVGAAGAAALTFLRGKWRLDLMRAASVETAKLTSMVFTILIGATALSLVFRGLGGDAALAGWIENSDLGGSGFLALVLAAAFIAGFFIDFIEITFILVPVVAPILSAMHVDLLWFGILMAVNLQTSFLTPPFGFALFYLKGVAPPQIQTRHLYRGVAPFIAIQLLVLLLLMFFPPLVTWLPGVLGQ